MPCSRFSKLKSFLLGLLACVTPRARLERVESARLGNLGDVKSLGGGLSEMRVHFGPGYRLYFARTGRIVLLLLSGGDKSTQKRDIERARSLRKELVQE